MTIKKLIFIIFVTIMACGILDAKNFTKKATLKPVLVQKGTQKNWCPVCGMNIKSSIKHPILQNSKMIPQDNTAP